MAASAGKKPTSSDGAVQHTSRLAVASFVCGLIGVSAGILLLVLLVIGQANTGWAGTTIGLDVLIGLAGLPLGPVALFKIRRSGGTEGGSALAAVGMAASALTVLVWIGFWVLVFIAISNAHFTM